MKTDFEHIDKKKYLLQLLRKHPFELLSYVPTALKTLQYRIIYRCIGRHTVVGKRTQITNYSNVRIGVHCLIQDNVFLRAGLEGRIIIGDYCAINSFAKLFGHGGIVIEDHAQIGPNCLLTTTTHNYRGNLKPHFLPIRIKKWAWIGAQSIILPNITIGERSVVGAGSVVTKDVPAHTVVAGNPARMIRTIDNEMKQSPNNKEPKT